MISSTTPNESTISIQLGDVSLSVDADAATRRDGARELFSNSRQNSTVILKHLDELVPFLTDDDPLVRGHVAGAIADSLFGNEDNVAETLWRRSRRALFQRLTDEDAGVRNRR